MPANTRQKPSIRLMAQVEPEGQADAVMAVRWCVSPALAATLKEQGIDKPFLLISVRPYHNLSSSDADGRKSYADETRRYLVPLTQELQYVSFSRPGHNSVTACVVSNKSGKGEWHLGQVFLARDSRSYEKTIFSYGGGQLISGYHEHKVGKSTYSGTIMPEVTDEITVVVPSEMFAKDYPNWVKDYISKFFKTKTFDQCHLRRRLMIATLLSPFFLIGGYIARVIQLVVGSFLGLRGVHIRSFLHPLQYGIFDVMENASRFEDSVWFRKARFGKLRPAPLLLLNPVSNLALAVILFVAGSIPVHVTGEENITYHWLGWSFWECLGVAVLAHLALVAIILVFMAIAVIISVITGNSVSAKISAGISKWWKGHQTKSSKTKQANKEAEKAARLKDLERELELMVCNGLASASVEALPKQKQTFKLRFQATKQKVCKPIAR